MTGFNISLGGRSEQLADTRNEGVVDTLAIGLALCEAGGEVGSGWGRDRSWISNWLGVHWAVVGSKPSIITLASLKISLFSSRPKELADVGLKGVVDALGVSLTLGEAVVKRPNVGWGGDWL